MTRLAEPKVSNDHSSETSRPHFQRLRVLAVSGALWFVAVVQSTDLTHRHDWPDFRRLNRSRLRRIFSQRQVRSGSVIVVKIGNEGSAQRAFTEHDHMVEACAPESNQ
jgi:hypothetical protein